MPTLPANAAPKREAARARLAKRHRAETRFQAYGIAAIALAGFFLVALLADIVIKAMPAFTKSELALDVPVTSDLVDVQDVKQGDFDGLLRAALRAQFPTVESRSDKKALDSILSSGAADSLRARVIADPSLIGKTVKVDTLLSSDTDLFIKGLSTRRHVEAGRGAAEVVAGEAAVSVTFEPGALDTAVSRLGGKKGETLTLDTTRPSLLVALKGGVVKAGSVAGDRMDGEVLIPFSANEELAAGPWHTIVFDTPETNRKINDKQAAFATLLEQKGMVTRVANTTFLTEGDSREPEQAGILGAMVGSALTMLVTLGICLPVGVGAAIYLEEFAPKNRFTHFIEVNINNLAAVPSIVFGLLGLAIFLSLGGMPRSSALVGGLVLALLVLPTIIIASRAALKSVPRSFAEAALALGATRQQAVFHHILPVAVPGIMTGTIIGMAHALGETAPLLMIGMVAFIADVPKSVTEAATVLPVQIFLWSDLPEVGFQARTAAAILVLLLFLVAMNGLAILIRKKFERRW